MKTSLFSFALAAAALLTAPSLASAQDSTQQYSGSAAQRQSAHAQDRAVNHQRRAPYSIENQSMADWSLRYNEQHPFVNN